jgi:hypothetical protein
MAGEAVSSEGVVSMLSRSNSVNSVELSGSSGEGRRSMSVALARWPGCIWRMER